MVRSQSQEGRTGLGHMRERAGKVAPILALLALGGCASSETPDRAPAALVSASAQPSDSLGSTEPVVEQSYDSNLEINDNTPVYEPEVGSDGLIIIPEVDPSISTGYNNAKEALGYLKQEQYLALANGEIPIDYVGTYERILSGDTTVYEELDLDRTTIAINIYILVKFAYQNQNLLNTKIPSSEIDAWGKDLNRPKSNTLAIVEVLKAMVPIINDTDEASLPNIKEPRCDIPKEASGADAAAKFTNGLTWLGGKANLESCLSNDNPLITKLVEEWMYNIYHLKPEAKEYAKIYSIPKIEEYVLTASDYAYLAQRSVDFAHGIITQPRRTT